MKVVLATITSILLHVLFGWEWTVLAGVLCGWLVVKRGWLWGLVSVAGGWGLIVLYDYYSAPAPIGRMLDATGQILGNLPGWVVVVLTVLIGGLIGMLGGLAGSQFRQLVFSKRYIENKI